MGLVLWVANLALGPLFGSGWRALALALLVGLGIASYFALAQLFGAVRFVELSGALRRQR